MITTTEQKFWKSIRRSLKNLGWWGERVENAVSVGWPDVMVFPTASWNPICLELKIARGAGARIVVRPPQIWFAEKVAERGGVYHFLILDDRRRGEFWVCDHANIQDAMEHGLRSNRTGAMKYDMKSLPLLLRRWSGEKVHVQYADTTSIEKPSWLEFVPKKILVRKSAVPLLRRARD